MGKKKIRNIKIGLDDIFSDPNMTVTQGEEINRFLKLLDNESDRGVVLTVVTVIDDLLKKHIENILNKGKGKILQGLFEFNGPFSTFYSKIDLLYCYGKLSEDDRYDLHLLRKLRNYVAHSWEEFTFNEDIENKYIKLFRHPLRFPENSENLYDTKSKFLLGCVGYLIILLLK